MKGKFGKLCHYKGVHRTLNNAGVLEVSSWYAEGGSTLIIYIVSMFSLAQWYSSVGPGEPVKKWEYSTRCRVVKTFNYHGGGGLILCLAWVLSLQLLYLLTLASVLHIHFSENQKLNTTPCWPRLVSITILATTLSWEQPVENTSDAALCQSQIQVCECSFVLCLFLSWMFLLSWVSYGWRTIKQVHGDNYHVTW